MADGIDQARVYADALALLGDKPELKVTTTLGNTVTIEKITDGTATIALRILIGGSTPVIFTKDRAPVQERGRADYGLGYIRDAVYEATEAVRQQSTQAEPASFEEILEQLNAGANVVNVLPRQPRDDREDELRTGWLVVEKSDTQS